MGVFPGYLGKEQGRGWQYEGAFVIGLLPVVEVEASLAAR